MLQKLRDSQQTDGAQLEGEPSMVKSFGQDQEAVIAASSGVAICDRTHWGLLELKGADRLSFLHNQSTNDLKALKVGQGCDTVILTSTARTIDLVSAYVTEDSILLLVSPSRREQLLQWFDRYIFFGDKVECCDLTHTLATFSLLGPESQALLEKWGLALPTELHQHQTVTVEDITLRIAVGSGLSTPGYTLLVSYEQAAELWQMCRQAGAVPMGTQAWEQLRVQQGRPSPDAELTEDYNPLEAGLWHAISLDKGCYIGQETIARLNTYNGVKQQLWGIQLEESAEPGASLLLEDRKVGILTSQVQTADGYLGLGYIKTKAGGAGLKVQIGEATGTVVAVPCLTRAIPTSE
ncbi:CAF17-like 4Fe-4S cluster assembly/insertion protein YgfZ [Acaryochloris thomasi]|nr:folate-binding protein YgfZ [Acaryochloris thomasi]